MKPSNIPKFDPKKSDHFFNENTRLLLLANEICYPNQLPPLPLRRTFSILRDYGFKTIYCEISSRYNDKTITTTLCHESNCRYRKESCDEYINCLKQKYNCTLENKFCYRISFFKSEISNAAQIANLKNEDLLTYCIVHKDFISKENKTFVQTYVTESYVHLPIRRRNKYIIGRHSIEPIIAGKKFFLKGNYFCQQNGITNCCAHAAIKMSLKNRKSDITASEISKAGGVDFKSKYGNEGWKPKEYVKAIKDLINHDALYYEARAFASPLYFLKLIYHAIESRLPVILLFSFPFDNFDNHQNSSKLHDSKKKSFKGHASALIGHSFNKDSWWSYGQSLYFSTHKTGMKYLPSFMWCDNFVIQDDNIGPYYLMPVNALRVSQLSRYLHKFLQSPMHKLSLSMAKRWPKFVQPTGCIVVPPKDFGSFKSVLNVEPYALKRLADLVAHISKKRELEQSLEYKNYFHPYYLKGQLVLRTYLIKTEAYLYELADHSEIANNYKYVESLSSHLTTKYVWITEISIPEMFWVNKLKLGEIIIDPEAFERNKATAARFIRLPGLYTFVSSTNRLRIYQTQEKEPRFYLINPDCCECYS